MTARMNHLDPVAPHQTIRFSNARKHVVDRRRYRRALMITQPVPLDPVRLKSFAQLLALANSFRRECFGTFEAEQSELHAALRQFAQVWNHLTLAQRIKHSVVGDKQHATAFKRHCQPPPELFCSSEKNQARATECCRESQPHPAPRAEKSPSPREASSERVWPDSRIDCA